MMLTMRLLSVASVALLLPSVTMAEVEGVSQTLSLPSLEEMQRRAAPWTGQQMRIERFALEPLTYAVHNLLTPTEVNELLQVARNGMKHQEAHGKHRAAVSVDRLGDVATDSPILETLDRRLGALVGVPADHVELGYFGIYNAGHAFKELHLDNHHALFAPLRIASFVIYLLVGEDDSAGGETVFPLARINEASVSPAGLDAQTVAHWGAVVNAAAANFQLGDEPQLGRVCAGAQKEPCKSVFSTAEQECASGGRSAFKAVTGSAVLFFNVDEGGSNLTVRAIHGSCPVNKGNKVVLAKFARAGPRPFSADQDAFTEAMQHRPRSKGAEL